MSFVGSEALASTLGPNGDGVYITQVVPVPEGDEIPLLAEYRKALIANDSTARPSFGSLEGYIAGRLTAKILAEAGDDPTRESFLSALINTKSFDIGGFTLKYDKGDNRGSDQVFMTVIRQGNVVPADRLTP